ncbi:MAG: alpha/beta hydrolase domain-containing protein [Halioglobus sp.]
MLAACSDGSDAGSRSLGVPGADNPGVVNVPAASLTGPLEGDPVLVSSFFSLASVDYEQQEFFVSGTANAYINRNELGSDGKWSVQAEREADYRTRIVVIRPIDATQFNGTVVVEWLNVSAGFDSAPDWGMLHTEFIRRGYAWVGVSAQAAGVAALLDGSAAAIIPGTPFDDRYADLVHPGDAFSYDIYSQVARLLRDSPLPLDGLSAQRYIAAGESQSAGRLMTYVNALAPIHALFDGYFIHSRTGGSAPLQGGLFDDVTVATPPIVTVRDDLATPVLMLQTETDLFVLGSWPSNQPDTDNFRLWEIAGSAHADLYTFFDARVDVGTNPAVAAVLENANPIPGIIECPVPVNAGPQHWVAKAAIAALNAWISDGVAPPVADRLAVTGSPATFVLDDLGNVRGGIRTPYVDVPIAVLSGEGQPSSDFDPDNPNFCFLSGTTKLFDDSTLASLYGDNAGYIERLNAATEAAVAAGFLLPEDAALIKAHAAGSTIFAP